MYYFDRMWQTLKFVLFSINYITNFFLFFLTLPGTLYILLTFLLEAIISFIGQYWVTCQLFNQSL